ncbi:MAG: hypothetical protein CMJ18_01820 [Phycisphaeraceae bacterium]|nr:hypothetical protein [Phycisphaeraceae bacterium]
MIRIRPALLIALLPLLGACSMTQRQPAAKMPSDAPPPRPRAQVRTEAPADAARDDDDPESMVVDAMVGQVNGKPIYVSSVYESIEDQLEQLGQDLPRLVFRARARELIYGELNKIVTEHLLLGEAERELTPPQQAMLRNVLKELREQRIREWGLGSPARATDRLLEKTGMDLDDKIEEDRQALLIKNYLTQKLSPKVSVSRRDIERYYNEHLDEFRSPAGRMIRLIRVNRKEHEKKIARLLEEGQPFEEVASLKINISRPERGGLFHDKPITGDKPFAIEALNEAIVDLGPGEHSPPIQVGTRTSMWVFVESVSQGGGKSLKEAQLEIHDKLRFQQIQDLTMAYHADLRETGSYDDLSEMASTLVQVAMTRFARPQ